MSWSNAANSGLGGSKTAPSSVVIIFVKELFAHRMTQWGKGISNGSVKAKEIRLGMVCVPVHSGWRPRVGDSVLAYSPAGDPRDRSTSLDTAYIVPPQVSVGPLVLSDFADVVPLSDEECHSLRATLGVTLTKETRDEIDAAIRRMVVTIALSARIPGWDAFRKRLQAIIKSGQDCIKAAQEFVRMADPSLIEEGNPKGGSTRWTER